MFRNKVKLFTLYGFEVSIDFSWIILAILITWSLAEGVFPHYYEGLEKNTYWIMGVFGAVGLFLSIIIHEFSHSVVARKFGLPIKGITLFIFGGVAEMEEEPPSSKAEFFMAVAGPLTSIALGFVFLGIRAAGFQTGWTESVISVFNYLVWINFILAGFNLIPAFPLDGGRVLRSILWRWKKNLRWATNIASKIGSIFGFTLIFIGIFDIIQGAIVGGIWFVMIGWFLQTASKMSYRKLIIRQALEGEQLKRFMKTDPITIPSDITVEEAIEDYFYKYHYKMFPVMESDKLVGCVTTKDIKNISKEERSRAKISDVLKSCSSENIVHPDTDTMKAMSRMSKTNNTRLMVVENGNLLGIITLKDMLKFLSLKLDLDDDVLIDVQEKM